MQNYISNAELYKWANKRSCNAQKLAIDEMRGDDTATDFCRKLLSSHDILQKYEARVAELIADVLEMDRRALTGVEIEKIKSELETINA